MIGGLIILFLPLAGLVHRRCVLLGSFLFTSLSLLFFELLSATFLELSRGWRVGVFLLHTSKLLHLPHNFSLAIDFNHLSLSFLTKVNLHLLFLVTDGPSANSVLLVLRGRNLELDKALETWEDPFLDEFGQHNLELASLRVNLFPESDCKCKKDLLELKEANLDTFGVDHVLADRVLVPLLFECGQLRLFLMAAGLFVNLRLLMLVERSDLGRSLSIELLQILVVFLSALLDGSVLLLARISLTVDCDRKWVLFVELGEHFVSQLVLKARAFSIVLLDDGHGFNLGDAHFRVNQLALSQQVDHIRYHQSDIFSQAGVCIRLLAEVLEDSPELLLVFFKDRLSNLEVFLQM